MLKHADHILSFLVITLVVAFLSYAQQPASQPVQDATALRSSEGPPESAATFDELKQLLKTRYDGKTLVTVVQGLFAGEQRKELFGPGENGIYWSHFAPPMVIPGRVGILGPKVSDLN